MVDYIGKKLEESPLFEKLLDVDPEDPQQGSIQVSNEVIPQTHVIEGNTEIEILLAKNLSISKEKHTPKLFRECGKNKGNEQQLSLFCDWRNIHGYIWLKRLIVRTMPPLPATSRASYYLDKAIFQTQLCTGFICERERQHRDAYPGKNPFVPNEVESKQAKTSGIDIDTEIKDDQSNNPPPADPFRVFTAVNLCGGNVDETSVRITVRKGENIRLCPITVKKRSFVVFWIPPQNVPSKKRARSLPTSIQRKHVDSNSIDGHKRRLSATTHNSAFSTWTGSATHHQETENNECEDDNETQCALAMLELANRT